MSAACRMRRKGSPDLDRSGSDGGERDRTSVADVFDKIATASFSAIRSVGDAFNVPRRQGKGATRALTRQSTDPINLAAFRARRTSQRLLDVQARLPGMLLLEAQGVPCHRCYVQSEALLGQSTERAQGCVTKSNQYQSQGLMPACQPRLPVAYLACDYSVGLFRASQ